MKRSNRRSVALASAALASAALALVLASAGCRQRVDGPGGVDGESSCRVVDSLLAASLPPRPWSMSGHATFDVAQYRVRGHFVLDVGAAGDVTFEFSGTTLFGGHREDMAVSLSGDTLRVFDRERARFYEGEQVDEMIREGTGTSGEWAEAVGRMVGVFSCNGVEGLQRRDAGLSGKVAGGSFRIDTNDGRLERTTWPDPTRADTFDDILQVSYIWRGGRLTDVTAMLPERGWRVRFERNE